MATDQAQEQEQEQKPVLEQCLDEVQPLVDAIAKATEDYQKLKDLYMQQQAGQTDAQPVTVELAGHEIQIPAAALTEGLGNILSDLGEDVVGHWEILIKVAKRAEVQCKAAREQQKQAQAQA
jgi:altronate dehydratase